jgi:hypothetical protein
MSFTQKDLNQLLASRNGIVTYQALRVSPLRGVFLLGFLSIRMGFLPIRMGFFGFITYMILHDSIRIFIDKTPTNTQLKSNKLCFHHFLKNSPKIAFNGLYIFSIRPLKSSIRIFFKMRYFLPEKLLI